MRKRKRARLEAGGWTVGSVKEFLRLSEADAVLIEMKLALSFLVYLVDLVYLVPLVRGTEQTR